MGDEVIHLPKASLVVAERKVITPSTNHLIDLANDGCRLLPCSLLSSEFAHPIPEFLLCSRTRLGVHVRCSLPRLLPAEGEPKELKAALATSDYSGLGFIEG